MTKRRWWEGQTPIYKGEGDGQEVTHIYARQVPDTSSSPAMANFWGEWEYAIVCYADDGTFKGVMVLRGGKAKVEGRELGFLG